MLYKNNSIAHKTEANQNGTTTSSIVRNKWYTGIAIIEAVFAGHIYGQNYAAFRLLKKIVKLLRDFALA